MTGEIGSDWYVRLLRVNMGVNMGIYWGKYGSKLAVCSPGIY